MRSAAPSSMSVGARLATMRSITNRVAAAKRRRASIDSPSGRSSDTGADRSWLEVGDQRSVIGRLGALARVAVDQHPRQTLGEGAAGEQQIDAHSPVLVERAGLVVPPREQAVL